MKSIVPRSKRNLTTRHKPTSNLLKTTETFIESNKNEKSGKNYITYTKRETYQLTMEEGNLLKSMHSHLQFLNKKLGEIESTSIGTVSFEEISDKILDLRLKTTQIEEVLDHVRIIIEKTENYQKIAEIEWFIMMLKQRFDNVEMLALGIECCDGDEDEELDFLNNLGSDSFHGMAVESKSEVYSLDLALLVM